MRSMPCGLLCRPGHASHNAGLHGNLEVRRAHGLTLRIRVGLNVGEVVVRAIGNDLHMDYSAVGRRPPWPRGWSNSPLLAASADRRSLRLIEGLLVQVHEVGPVPVDMAKPVAVFELTGAGPRRSRPRSPVDSPVWGERRRWRCSGRRWNGPGSGTGAWSPPSGKRLGKSRLMYELFIPTELRGG